MSGPLPTFKVTPLSPEKINQDKKSTLKRYAGTWPVPSLVLKELKPSPGFLPGLKLMQTTCSDAKTRTGGSGC